ncbi:sugar ABC transporter permease [Tersicoccus phoenicis]|uniref:Transport permease protein n=1 Tax=Tersicoccus phoenicis TaxID=554083 RepID=A0A1R1LHN9_9MICC|nr:ABC transporter permease [Tersicoccus phoenicis]OMH27055.1 sugar ABC transporter permease [Tersicoccus phoenicis]
MTTPGRSRGFRDVIRHFYLLRLLVNKEVKVRYRGSVLGLLWSYIRPAVQFVVFYVAMGIFLELEKGTPNYAIYLFSGIVVINFFSEAFGNGARAMVANGGLIKKIFLPRQLFSFATLWVAGVHFVPQMVVLVIACLIVGWAPSLLSVVAILVGLIITAVFATGLGLIFGAANVFFRDSENLVDLYIMVATWLSPVLYTWTMVQDKFGDLWFNVYMLNPLTPAVELFHFGWWRGTVDGRFGVVLEVPPHLFTVWTPLAALVALLTLLVGSLMFSRLEGRFAQEL